MKTRKKLIIGLLFILPWLIHLGVFIGYPIVISFYYSFTDYSLLSAPEWIGLDNYKELLNEDDVFKIVVKNTLWYVIVVLPLNLIVALIIALLLDNKIKLLSFFRALFYAPHLLPIVVVGLVWRWIFNGEYGILNYILSSLGIYAPPWLASPSWIKPAIVLVEVFLVGQLILMYLAGLKNVPEEIYEAALLDGANWWYRVWKITLPMISPVIQFNLITQLISVFQVFAIPYVLTVAADAGYPVGGPGRASTFYVMYIWEKGFTGFRMGYASAMAWIMFIVIFLLTLTALRLGRRWVFHLGE